MEFAEVLTELLHAEVRHEFLFSYMFKVLNM